jgi:DNA ligase-1
MASCSNISTKSDSAVASSSEEEQNIEIAHVQAIQRHFGDAINRGCEGLMLKLLHGPKAVYRSGERGKGWLKLKKDYIQGMVDTIDVVPIGAWRGTGRKVRNSAQNTKFQFFDVGLKIYTCILLFQINWYSPVLLAIWDADSERFQTLCKCMSGFSDEFYSTMKQIYQPRIIPKPRPDFDITDSLTPEFYFEPFEVWEIAGADLTLSPVHTAGKGTVHGDDDDNGRGISLRFPRFIRSRPDKPMEQATTSSDIVKMFWAQSQRQKQEPLSDPE